MAGVQGVQGHQTKLAGAYTTMYTALYLFGQPLTLAAVSITDSSCYLLVGMAPTGTAVR